MWSLGATALAQDLNLVTVSLSIEYGIELFSFDEVEGHMRLEALAGHRIDVGFDYQVVRSGMAMSAAQARQIVARLVLPSHAFPVRNLASRPHISKSLNYIQAQREGKW